MNLKFNLKHKMAKQEVMSSEDFKRLMSSQSKKEAKPKLYNSIVQVKDPTFPIKVMIKPLSVNDAWQGKRYKTELYESYEKVLTFMLPSGVVIPPPPYEIRLWFGLSNALSDWDNPIKQCQDILAKKYNFNDKLIKRGVVEVEDVKKGEEYIRFEIVHYIKQPI